MTEAVDLVFCKVPEKRKYLAIFKLSTNVGRRYGARVFSLPLIEINFFNLEILAHYCFRCFLLAQKFITEMEMLQYKTSK